MELNIATPLLGGLSPAAFMQRHWQKKPLLVRQAWPGVQPPLARPALFELASRAGVESRLVEQHPTQGWFVRNGPLPRRALPPLSRNGWTLLVQGLDLHVPAAHEMLSRFRFIRDARLDDLMVAWASDQGGVGPHIDSYDVFLLQVHGRRRWRIGKVTKPLLRADAPLKLLREFEPTHDWLLEPGDMLYLPPGWGHDGAAQGGDCMTCSIGFRAPAADTLARELLLRLADQAAEGEAGEAALYRDPGQPATATPGELPSGLLAFAQRSLQDLLNDPQALPRALGEVLSEPKDNVWFEAQRRSGESADQLPGRVRLAAATRMLYDARHVFINGEALIAGGRDAQLMRKLADTRVLGPAERRRLSKGAAELLAGWIDAGWAHTE
ncbi:MAG TPA: cupin domain-containing protein [Rubrivivax sp.]|nr:cupin domain-containing protein [Rubrivivax sp.]